MQRILSGTRYLVFLPILGLAIAAAILFVFGSIGLIKLLVEVLVSIFSGMFSRSADMSRTLVVIEIVEFVHTFLVGTVLFITAGGFYQLFIHEVDFPDWLKIDSTEELESNLIGIVIVVLAVNFMSVVFIGEVENLLLYGGGIALPIAALGLFLGLRAWTNRITKETSEEEKNWRSESEAEHVSQ